jgi:hypothetical protein
LIELLFSPIRTFIENNAGAVLRTTVGTPHPNAVFVQPTNDPWAEVYAVYWRGIIPLCLSLFGLSVGVVILLESTSHLFSSYHRSKLKRRAFSGLLGILAWWWLAALSLRFMDALAGLLVPSLSTVSLFKTLSFSGMGILGTVVALSADFVLFLLVALIYIVRQFVLYLFVFLMPLLIVLWIPGVGPFALVSRFMRKLAGFYVPFLFMTIPVALLLRLADVLGSSLGPSGGEFGAWVTALVLPLLAVLSPIVLIWQAGALFFVADRTARHVSASRANDRLQRGRTHAREGEQAGRNFVRGLRNAQPVDKNGQYMLGSGDSRAYAVGQRLHDAGGQLRDRFSPDTASDGGKPPSTGSGGDGGDGGDSGSPDQSEATGSTRPESIRAPPMDEQDDDSDTDQPWYIQ